MLKTRAEKEEVTHIKKQKQNLKKYFNFFSSPRTNSNIAHTHTNTVVASITNLIQKWKK